MKASLVYTRNNISHVTWGIAITEKGLVNIKKDSARTMIQRIKSTQRSKVKYSQMKRVINSISVIEMEADDPTGGLHIEI